MGNKILIFGQLTDIIGVNEMLMQGIHSTDELIKKLNKMYPPLLLAKYSIAVNKIIIQSNTGLNEGDIVALLPPFSGG